MHWIGILAALGLVILDFVLFFSDRQLFYFLMGIAFLVVALPFIIGLTLDNKNEEKIGELFLEFSRNLAESVAIGTPVSKAIINVKHKNYGILNPFIIKMANQIELGISVEKAMQNFAYETNSGVIKRAVGLISEAEKAGGQIDFILDSTARSISEVEKLKKERKSAIYSLVVEGYIIFFIFIGIILIMEFKILPLTEGISGFSSFTSGNLANLGQTPSGTAFTAEEMSRPFFYLLLTQGFFIGLVIGKLTEDSIKRGLKHSLILMLAAFLISTGARLFITPGAA